MPHLLTARRLVRPARPLGLLVLLTAVLTAGAPSVIRLRPGDTLSQLALEHHTSVAVLQALNHMGGSTLIYAGQTLLVPGAQTATSAPPAARTRVSVYVVRPGDGLIVVARRFRTTPERLQGLNHLRTTTLLIGQRLLVPVARPATATEATEQDDAPQTAPSTAVVSVPGAVLSSAAADRATLSARALPSRAAVQDMIRRSARRHGVPVDLALALSYQESGFQQGVVSPVDAIGALQVLPSTALALGRLHGRTYDLLRASDNVEAGITLLADLIQATGDVDKALAGYYQGLGSISRIGLLAETRQYVRNIEALRQRFR